MSLKRSMQSCDSGFTLLELLVSLMIGLLAIGLTLTAVMSIRNVYKMDLVRTRISQDIRGAIDIIGADIRVAGENFSSSFPAVEIVNGANGGPDELYLRRNLLDEVLKVCQDISVGDTGLDIMFATGGGGSSRLYLLR